MRRERPGSRSGAVVRGLAYASGDRMEHAKVRRGGGRRCWRCGRSAAASDDDAGDDRASPVKIRMGWGIPAEEIKYVMMHHPQVAAEPGQGVRDRVAGVLRHRARRAGARRRDARLRDGRRPVGGQRDRPRRRHRDPRRVHRGAPGRTSRPPGWCARTPGSTRSTTSGARRSRPTPSAARPTTCRTSTSRSKAGLKPDRDYKKVEVPFGQMQETLLVRPRRHGAVPAAVLRRDQRDRRRQADVPPDRRDRAVRAAAQRLPARLRRGQPRRDRGLPGGLGAGRGLDRRARQPRRGDRGQRARRPRSRADVLDKLPAHEAGLLPPAARRRERRGAAARVGLLPRARRDQERPEGHRPRDRRVLPPVRERACCARSTRAGAAA